MTQWIFKILRSSELDAAKANTAFFGSPADTQDGFIHFSTIEQLGGTVGKHFTGVDICHLMVFDAKSFSADLLKWEPSRGGQLFPHLYGPLDISLAVENWTIERESSGQFNLSAAQQWISEND